MNTFKVLGLLMSYPRPEWVSHLDECSLVLKQENFLPKKLLRAVLAFIEELDSADLYGVQEQYVATFDRGRSHSLHLFEHIHGESRDRGQAMVDLASAYEEKGLFIDQAELPDYIPLFLEFLSLCPVNEAVTALVALSRVKPSQDKIEEVLAQGLEDSSLEALDKEWEEAAAFAGQPDQPGCRACVAPTDGLNVTIR